MRNSLNHISIFLAIGLGSSPYNYYKSYKWSPIYTDVLYKCQNSKSSTSCDSNIQAMFFEIKLAESLIYLTKIKIQDLAVQISYFFVSFFFFLITFIDLVHLRKPLDQLLIHPAFSIPSPQE